MGKLVCLKCRKPLKENTDGDPRYCTGHEIELGAVPVKPEERKKKRESIFD